MKKYKITKEYLIDRGHGWEGWALSDEVEEFEALNQKEAKAYFRKHYGPIVNIYSDNFYIKNGKRINVYELQTIKKNDYNDELCFIATAIAKQTKGEKK